ncbi:hypothetical protein DXG01_008324 [Tephrocybe rancida]|nr:hypothetical protein DXG01_008324 [Tephrocybe rancida]
MSTETSSTTAAIGLGPWRKPTNTHPLTTFGRHFGRTIHAFCRLRNLVERGILRDIELATRPLNTFSQEERQEHRIYRQMLQILPQFEEQIVLQPFEEIAQLCDLIQKGSSNARADDTKGLKGAVLDWITPPGEDLNPRLARNIKSDRGFYHPCTGALLCPVDLDWSNEETKTKLRSQEINTVGDQWPTFLFHNYHYDVEDPWNGLFRSHLLVTAYKYIFTSPSSVDKEPKATKSGNARIHGMTRVTQASIAYVATQVRFALSSTATFSRSDLVLDSERFYLSILELFDDVDEQQEVNDLVNWWNRQIFPSNTGRMLNKKDTVHSKIKAKRAALMALSINASGSA